MLDTAFPAAADRPVLAAIDHPRTVLGVAPPDASPRESIEARAPASWAPIRTAGA